MTTGSILMIKETNLWNMVQEPYIVEKRRQGDRWRQTCDFSSFEEARRIYNDAAATLGPGEAIRLVRVTRYSESIENPSIHSVLAYREGK